jgi:hypothetical protein
MACVAAIVLRRSRDATADPEVTGSVTSEHGEIAALAALRKAGNDPAKRSEITYYLDFPNGASADRAADSVRALDFSATVISGRDGVYACIASRRMIPEQSVILETTKKMTSLAKSLGGKFDRWEAEVAQ